MSTCSCIFVPVLPLEQFQLLLCARTSCCCCSALRQQIVIRAIVCPDANLLATCSVSTSAFRPGCVQSGLGVFKYNDFAVVHPADGPQIGVG